VRGYGFGDGNFVFKGRVRGGFGVDWRRGFLCVVLHVGGLAFNAGKLKLGDGRTDNGKEAMLMNGKKQGTDRRERVDLYSRKHFSKTSWVS